MIRNIFLESLESALSEKGWGVAMKKNGWRYAIAVGMAFVFAVGGLGMSVSAAGKKAEKDGAEIVLGAVREIESIKITMNAYSEKGTGTVESGKLNEGAENSADKEAGTDMKESESEEGDDFIADSEDTEESTGEAEAGDETEEAAATEQGEGEEPEEKEENAEEIDAYFDDSVFVGDSIMLGFRNYAMKRQDTFLSRMNFLAAGSFSANNALWEVKEDSVHPVYQGKQRQVWESIALMGGKKIFIMLGMNDLNITGVEGSCEKYKELIGKIKESNPDTEIYIMSMTYVLKGKETGKLENNTIREYNAMLEAMAEENGWGFVDIAEALADENGDLAEEYCSDGFAHQNPEAYDVWVSVLRKYAGEHLQ